MFNLHQLDIFAKVVQAGSFSKAATDLLMSQSAVSQHMRALEVNIGATLFERGARGVSLTRAGETLHTYTDQIFGLLAEAQRSVLAADGHINLQMNIGATPGVSVYLLPQWLSSFRELQTSVEAQVQTDICTVLVDAIRSDDLDIAIVEGEIEEENHRWLKVQKLYEVEQLVVVGHKHPWYTKPHVTMAELHDQYFVVRQPDSHTRLWLDDLFAKHNVVPRIDTVLDNIESIKRAVAINQSITILPPYAIEQELELGTLQALSILGNPLLRTLRLVYNREIKPKPIINTFVQHLLYSPSFRSDNRS